MIHILSKPLILIFLFFGLYINSHAHQLKFSTTLIEYNKESNEIEFMFNLFMDDFLFSANKILPKEVDFLSPSKTEKRKVKKYFDTYFKIAVNGVVLDLKFEEIEVHTNYNAFRFKFSCSQIYIQKGDVLFIENNLLFNEFGYKQTNMNVIRMLPFFEEKHYQATYQNSSQKLIIN